jgi:hypothetical protein
MTGTSLRQEFLTQEASLSFTKLNAAAIDTTIGWRRS